MELKKGLLALTEIESSSDYESERKISTSSVLSFYISLPFTSPPLSLTLIDSLPFVVATTGQKTNSNISNKSQGRYQVEITRELDKESLMYCYLIYTIDT